jgi:hypothetical protein
MTHGAASLLAGLPSRGAMLPTGTEAVCKQDFRPLAAPQYIQQDVLTATPEADVVVVPSEDVWSFFVRFPGQGGSMKQRGGNKRPFQQASGKFEAHRINTGKQPRLG